MELNLKRLHPNKWDINKLILKLQKNNNKNNRLVYFSIMQYKKINF